MQIDRPIPAALGGLVERIVGYDYRLDSAAVHFGVPNPGVTVIISFDEPLDVGWADGRDRALRWILAAGLHTRPALIRTHGLQHGIQLALTPQGCRALLGQSSASLANALAEHDDVALGIPRPLHEQLADSGWQRRFELLERHLCHLAMRSRHQTPGDLSHAWHLLTTSHGGIRIEQLAREVGWSRRHLAHRFRAEFGVGPKEVARLHRFLRAQELAQGGLAWSDVAARSGYADQSHLNREFRSLAGQTPKAWRQEVFPNLQEMGGAQ